MANLARYKGTGALPNVRQPQVVADTASGRAIAGLGAQLQSTAAQVGQHAERLQLRQLQIDNVQREKGLLDFSSAMSERELEATQELAPGASGYTDGMLSRFDEDGEKFVSGLPEAVRAQAEIDVKRMRSQFIDRYAQTELDERTRFFKQNVAEGTDQLAKSIRSNPNAFDEAKANGRRLIETTGLGRIEKEQALRSWDRMASLAWVETLPASERSRLFNGASVDAGSLLRAKEGFQSKAYPDKGGPDGQQFSGWRAGYGSDTVTKEDGTVVRVTKDTVVTRADAERDLKRRLDEFQGIAVQSVGSGAWQALPIRAQAALTSITYNYGELPSRLHGAVKSGDLEEIATAIEGLKGDNAGINSSRRQEEADIVRGVRRIPNAPPEIQTRLDALRYEDQIKLSDQAQRDMAGIAADRKDAFALSIAQDPEAVTQISIVSDDVLDDGQKAALIKSRNAALKEGQERRSAVDWFNGEGQGNPLSADDRKAAGRIWDALSEEVESPDALADAIVDRKGVIPKQFMNLIRNGLNGTNPQQTGLAYQRAARMFSANEAAVRGAEGGDAVEDAAIKWRVYTESLGLSPEEAGKRLGALNEPDNARVRQAILGSPEVVKKLKLVDADYIEGLLDPGIWSFAPTLGATASGRSVAVAEFKQILEESIGDVGGDIDAAEALAKDRFSRTWGTSELNEFGDGVVVKYPAEKIFPAIDESHEYIRTQAKEVLSENGVEFDPVGVVGTDQYTVQDIRAGRLPAMAINYRDGDGLLQTFPLAFTPDLESAQAELAERKAKEVVDLAAENARRAERLVKFGNRKKARDNSPSAPSNAELFGIVSDAVSSGVASGANAVVDAGGQIFDGLSEMALNPNDGGNPRSRRARENSERARTNAD
ncbi:lysozyme [Roseibium algae]|uniref:Lysozyme n=1 Tax=Roseibium algae TaxID=3123038 RepID=A0ABU8TKA3_9HYPH